MEPDRISELRDEVRQKLEVLRKQSAPILDELSRLERLAASLDEFEQKPDRINARQIGFVRGGQVALGPTTRLSSDAATTPHENFTFPILESLYELGGAATRDAVLNKVEIKLSDQLKPRDLEKLRSCGDLRWRNRASFQRKNMIREGLLQKHSRFGVWEMTSQGLEYLKENLMLLKRILGDEYGNLGHPEI